MKKIIFCLLTILFMEVNCSFGNISDEACIQGEFLLRPSNSSQYKVVEKNTIPDGAIVMIPDKVSSFSYLLLNDHKIKLYPGASFKLSKKMLMPIIGRFEFNSDENIENSIDIISNNYNAGYSNGLFLLEATPDNGCFFAMKNTGAVWIKDSYRKVYELKSGQQLHVPLYGQSVLKNRVEAFWGKSPSCFGNLGEIGQESAYGIVKQNKLSSFKDLLKEDSKEETYSNEESQILNEEK